MRNCFTDKARLLWSKAEFIAKERCEFLGPEHVFLAFLETDEELAQEIKKKYIKSINDVKRKLEEKTVRQIRGEHITKQLLKQIRKEANLSFSPKVNVQHILRALIGHDYEDYRSVPRDVLKEIGVDIDWLMKQVWRLKPRLKENLTSYTRSASSSPLDKYGRDLTRLALEKKLDPVALRDREINEVIEIISRRVKSNPILVGEPGVGKRAILIGLAQRIVKGLVPERLKNARIFEINLTSVLAGASLQGEFEKRMINIINYIKAEPNIILFIDEIHTLVGTGGQPGLGDAASILKTPLVNGDLKCIGATTRKEYRRYIEKDASLARSFQTIEISELSVQETIQIVYSIKHLYENFHKVRLSRDIIRKAVEMSQQYIRDCCLPEKAIDLLDQTCAHVSLKGKGSFPEVTEKDLIMMVAVRTKITIEKITSDKLHALLNLEFLLKKRIIGQDEAIHKVADVIRMTKSGLDLKPVRPDGVFLFLGPTGVGKTELARVLAEILFADESKMIRLDMSEYMEPHSISKLIGSPPGYIGSDQEGGLTSKVRTEPNSIILLDEVEKAHPNVLNIFLQVFEDGRLTDSQGRTVFFSNCTIIMTSNLGATKVFQAKREIGFNEPGERNFEQSKTAVQEAVRKFLSPEFINRIDEIICFQPLDKASIKLIAKMKLDEIIERFRTEGKTLEIQKKVLEVITDKGYNPEYGARFLNRILEDLVLKPLSKKILGNPEADKYTVAVEFNEIVIQSKGGEPVEQFGIGDITKAK